MDAPLDQGSEIKLHMPALIPEDYLPDINGRLILYKRIAATASDSELRELQVEMIDRFGLLPEALKNLFRITALKLENLFQVSSLRLRAQALGIRAIEAGPQGGSIDFHTNTRVHPLSLVKLVQSDPRAYKLAGATRLRFHRELPDSGERQQYVEQLLESFATDATENAA